MVHQETTIRQQIESKTKFNQPAHGHSLGTPILTALWQVGYGGHHALLPTSPALSTPSIRGSCSKVDGPARPLAGPAEELDRRRFGGGRSPEHAPSETIELVEAWRFVGERCPGRAPWVSGHPTAESHTLAHIFIRHIFS